MKISARSFTFGALAATAMAVPMLVGSAGCDVQDLQAQPDAAPAKCAPGPFLFGCDVVGADQPHCSSDDPASAALTQLPRGMNYPVGCTVNFVGERDQVGGDCKLDTVCHCVQTQLVVPDDAGADAAEAGLATPAPTPTGTPVWQCG